MIMYMTLLSCVVDIQWEIEYKKTLESVQSALVVHFTKYICTGIQIRQHFISSSPKI